MRPIIPKIDKLQKVLHSKKPYNKELLKIWQEKLRIDWTYNSNALEGNTLTYGETVFFLREGLTSEGKPLKDYLETKNHAEAIDWLYDIIKDKRRITNGFIKQLHSLLLRNIEYTRARSSNGKVIKKNLTAGKYKIKPNHVLTLSGRIHHYVEPIHVQDEMDKLLNWFHNEKKLHVIEKATVFHYRFVAIHPFDDGNGRMSRLLMNLILIKAGYPPCVIKNNHRRQYLKCLETLDKKKDYTPFIDFVGNELLNTQKLMLDVLEGNEGLDIPTPPTLNRDERFQLILAKITKTPLSIGQLVRLIPEIKRATLKMDIKNLIRAKKIKKKGKGKGVVYFK